MIENLLLIVKLIPIIIGYIIGAIILFPLVKLIYYHLLFLNPVRKKAKDWIEEFQWKINDIETKKAEKEDYKRASKEEKQIKDIDAAAQKFVEEIQKIK